MVAVEQVEENPEEQQLRDLAAWMSVEVAKAVREAKVEWNNNLISTVVDYSHGCVRGKTDFLQEFGLEWPIHQYQVWLQIEVDSRHGDPYYAIREWKSDLRDTDAVTLLDSNWEREEDE